MKHVLLSAIAGIIISSPVPAQNRSVPSPLKTVQSAMRNATIEPAPGAFVSGAQVYPFSEGTIYQVYAAPGRIIASIHSHNCASTPAKPAGIIASDPGYARTCRG